MNYKLSRRFVEKGVLNKGTFITASVKTKGIGIELTVVDKDLIVTELQETQCIAISPNEIGYQYSFPYKNIKRIEGMDVARVASSYSLNLDGSNKKTKGKPGRKPKNHQEISERI